MICTDLQAANQLQITANHVICRGRFSTFFRPLICTDLQLICKLQITANQSLPTFKKHCKTRANQRKSLQITPPENHRKNDADLQPCSASWWDGKPIFWKAGRTFAASELCISANSSCSYLRSGLLPLPATATDTLLLLLAAFCCCLLLPAAAYCFVYFSRFQPDLPEPIQNAWFSCHLLLFLAISYYFLPFPACHAVSCNFL